MALKSKARGSKRQILRKKRIYKARFSMQAPSFDNVPQKRIKPEDPDNEGYLDSDILPDEDMIDYGRSESNNSSSSEEENCEETVRPLKSKAMNFRLPIKVDGKLVEQSEECKDMESDYNVMIQEVDDRMEEENVPECSFVQHICQEHQNAQEFKKDVATRCLTIIQSEESEIVSPLKFLVGTMRHLPNSEVFKTTILIVSLAEVFLNITPGYRIRVPTEREKAIKVKKETFKLRNFEEGYLCQYRLYLEHLEKIIKNKHSPSILFEISVKSLCKLILELRHFNYSPNIIKVLIPCLECKNSEISTHVENCIAQLLREDREMTISEQVVKSTCQWIKQRHFKVDCKVINVFLNLNIKEVNLERHNKSEKKEEYRQMSRREKKRLKETAKLRKTLQEETIAEKNERLLSRNTLIMEQVFHCYFRVMRSYQKNLILKAVLHGLSNFAHLINVDFNDSLMECLRDIMANKKSIGSHVEKEIFYCLITAGCVQLKQKPGLTGIDVDTTNFFQELYEILPEVCNGGVLSSDFQLLLSSLKQLLIRQTKKLNRNRVLAFVKRICTVAINCQWDCLVASLLLCVHQILMSLTWPAEAIFMSDKGGIYKDEVNHPDFCDAQNASLFEMAFFQKSLLPEIKQVAKLITSSDESYTDYVSINEYLLRIEGLDAFDLAESSFKKLKASRRSKIPIIHDDYLRHYETKMLAMPEISEFLKF